MRIWIIPIAVLLILSSSFVIYNRMGPFSGNSVATSSSSITASNTSGTSTQSIINPIPTTVSSNPIPPIYLSLHLTLNSTVMLPSDIINITMSDFNTLATYNDLVNSDSWSLPSILDWWPCSGLSMYYGIFQGYDILSNITGAVPLPLFPPGYLLACPDLSFSSFQFHPASDIATVTGGVEISLETSMVVAGYYSTTPQVLTNGSSYTILHFTQGAYTVVAGDEWGDLAVSHFEVV